MPWTQRLSTGTTRGIIIGAIADLAIGLLASGPFGLIGWMTLIAAVGGIIGGITDVCTDPVFYTMIKKAISSLFEIINQPKNNTYPANPTLQRNRYTLFSCKEPVISQEHEFHTSIKIHSELTQTPDLLVGFSI